MAVIASIVIAVTVLANMAAAIADFLRAKFVLGNAAKVGVPARWLPVLGALKAAGGLGLVPWFAGLAVLQALAAAGLVCYFLIAVAIHVRTRVFRNIAFPGAYLILAVASLWLIIGTW